MEKEKYKKVTMEIELFTYNLEEVIPIIMEVLERNVGLLPPSGSVMSGLGHSPMGGYMNIKVEEIE